MLSKSIPSMILATAVAAALAGASPLAAQLTTGDGLLVSSQWLAQHQHDKDLVILQVWPEPGYRKEHIAGSRFVKLSSISTPFQAGTLSLEMPPDATLRNTLEQLGISDRSRIVVVFDSGDGPRFLQEPVADAEIRRERRRDEFQGNPAAQLKVFRL